MQLSFAPLQRTDGFQASEAVMRVTRAATRHSSLSNGRSALKQLTGQSAYSHPKSLIEAKHYYFPVVIFFRKGAGSASGQGLGRSMPEQSPVQLRLYLSHFLPAGQDRDRLGQRVRRHYPATMSICGNDSIIGHGRRRKQAHDEHQAGLRSGAVTALVAGRLLPFCHCFLSPTRTTVCWLVVGRCCGALWSVAAGRRQHQCSRIRTVCPIHPLSAAGRMEWS